MSHRTLSPEKAQRTCLAATALSTTAPNHPQRRLIDKPRSGPSTGGAQPFSPQVFCVVGNGALPWRWQKSAPTGQSRRAGRTGFSNPQSTTAKPHSPAAIA